MHYTIFGSFFIKIAQKLHILEFEHFYEQIYSQFSVAPSWLKRTEHDTCGMAPVFEMFNHAEDNNAFFDFDKINKKLYVAAIKDIQEGEQVFINYSDREDDEMLMHYGFSFPPNVNKHSFLDVSKDELRYFYTFFKQIKQLEC